MKAEDSDHKHYKMTEPVMSIGTFSEKVGLSISAIRKYEKEGLLISHRSASGRRLFSYEDIDRVRLIQHAIKEVGLNIEGIRRILAMLPCWELLPCASEKREECPSYREKTKPCWMLKENLRYLHSEICRRCPVYRFGSQCTQDMKSLVYGHAHLNSVVQKLRKKTEKNVESQTCFRRNDYKEE